MPHEISGGYFVEAAKQAHSTSFLSTDSKIICGSRMISNGTDLVWSQFVFSELQKNIRSRLDELFQIILHWVKKGMKPFLIFPLLGYTSPTFELNKWSTFVQTKPSVFGSVLNFTVIHSMTCINAQFMNN